MRIFSDPPPPGKDEALDWLLRYNRARLHSTLNYVSPMQFEQDSGLSTEASASGTHRRSETGYGKAGKQQPLSNFPAATTTTKYIQLWDTDSMRKANLSSVSGDLSRVHASGMPSANAFVSLLSSAVATLPAQAGRELEWPARPEK